MSHRGKDLRLLLASSTQAMQQAREALSDARSLLSSRAGTRANLDATLRDLAAAAASLRGFASDVERNPQLLLTDVGHDPRKAGSSPVRRRDCSRSLSVTRRRLRFAAASLYTLEPPDRRRRQRRWTHAMVIEIRRVIVPDYLDLQDILVRDGSRLERSPRGRWASRFSVRSPIT